MDTKDTLVCNYEILEKILPSLGKEKYLFSISDRFRSWGAEIVRNRYIFYLVIFVIWVGLSIIRPKKNYSNNRNNIIDSGLKRVYHVCIYIYLHDFPIGC